MKTAKPLSLFFFQRSSAQWPRLVIGCTVIALAGCTAIHPSKRAHMATAEPSPSASPLAASSQFNPATPSALSPAAAKSVLSCSDQKGSVHSAAMQSAILGSPMDYSIYLPPCYAADTATRYPVLYLFHGLGRSPDQWIELGLVPTADHGIISGSLPLLLIVMPQIADEKLGPAAMVADLLPAIDAHYQTMADKKHRAVGGISRGAEWALRLGLGRTDLFSSIGVHSLSPGPDFWNDLASMEQAVPDGNGRIYIDIGLSDSMFPESERLTESWDAKAWVYEKHFQPGDHSDAYWSQHLPEYLAWYSQPWK